MNIGVSTSMNPRESRNLRTAMVSLCLNMRLRCMSGLRRSRYR